MAMHGSSPKIVLGDNYSRKGAAPGITGFSGNVYSIDRGARATDTIYLYSDIGRPSNRAFWKVHGPLVDMTTDNEAMASGSRATHTVDAVTSTNYSALMISGSFDGAGGKFTCDASCTGTIEEGYNSHVMFADGKPDFNALGSWTFAPTTLRSAVVPYRNSDDEKIDAEHLYFGVWSKIAERPFVYLARS